MGHCTSGGYAGKLVGVYYFLGCSDAAPDPDDYVFAGWRRGTGISVSKDSIDVTTAGSAGSFREKIQTFTEITGSFDGVAKREDNIKTLRQYIMQTPQADCWIKMVIPDEAGSVEVIEIQAMFNSYSLDAPYDAEGSNSVEWEAVAVPIFTDVPSFTMVPAVTSKTQASGATTGNTVVLTFTPGTVDKDVFLSVDKTGLTATAAAGTITLTSTTPGVYVVTVTSAINHAVTATITVTITA